MSERTFLVWRYNTTDKVLISERPEVVQAESAQAASDLFYRQALVVEAFVSFPQSPPQRPQEGET